MVLDGSRMVRLGQVTNSVEKGSFCSFDVELPGWVLVVLEQVSGGQGYPD